MNADFTYIQILNTKKGIYEDKDFIIQNIWKYFYIDTRTEQQIQGKNNIYT